VQPWHVRETPLPAAPRARSAPSSHCPPGSEHARLPWLVQADRDKLRRTMIDIVLATDMKQHLSLTSHFNTVHRINLNKGTSGGECGDWLSGWQLSCARWLEPPCLCSLPVSGASTACTAFVPHVHGSCTDLPLNHAALRCPALCTQTTTRPATARPRPPAATPTSWPLASPLCVEGHTVARSRHRAMTSSQP
jgi:hypothetical protein